MAAHYVRGECLELSNVPAAYCTFGAVYQASLMYSEQSANSLHTHLAPWCNQYTVGHT